jgi:hypothetical protein
MATSVRTGSPARSISRVPLSSAAAQLGPMTATSTSAPSSADSSMAGYRSPAWSESNERNTLSRPKRFTSSPWIAPTTSGPSSFR